MSVQSISSSAWLLPPQNWNCQPGHITCFHASHTVKVTPYINLCSRDLCHVCNYDSYSPSPIAETCEKMSLSCCMHAIPVVLSPQRLRSWGGAPLGRNNKSPCPWPGIGSEYLTEDMKQPLAAKDTGALTLVFLIIKR